MPPVALTHPYEQWRVAHLDGLHEDVNSFIIWEGKYVGQAEYEAALRGEVPLKNKAQLQHQLDVTTHALGKLGFVHYFAYNGQHGALVVVHSDLEYQEELAEREGDFWIKVQTDTPPAKDPERDADERTDRDWQRAADIYKAAYERVKLDEDYLEEAKQELLALTKGKITVGGGVRVTKFQRAGNVDYAKVPQLVGVDVDAYRKTGIEVVKVTVEDQGEGEQQW